MTATSIVDENVVSKFPREIAQGIFWLNHCIPTLIYGKIVHVHLSIYLIIGRDKTLLVDTSLPTYWSDISEQVERALNGRTLDYLFITHPEIPHSGSMPFFLDKYPGLNVIGDMRDFHIYFPDYEKRFINVHPGDTIDLGGRSIRFVEAVIKDLPNTLWGYDDLTHAMFVSDGFSYSHQSFSIKQDRSDPISSSLQNVTFSPDDEEETPTHTPGECALLSSELSSEVSVEQASVVLQRALTFSRFIYPGPLFERVDKLLAENPPKLICPSHGGVIDSLDDVLPIIRKTHALAFESGTARSR